MENVESSAIIQDEMLADEGSVGYKRLNSIDKLHNLTAQIAPPVTPSNKEVNNLENFSEQDEADDGCTLENVRPIRDIDFETDFDSKDSWLFESPVKTRTPVQPRSVEVWLKENVSTPELLRVRGSLSAALEVIAIESRKGHYEKLRKDSNESRRISKGRSGSCLSLDWDYDESDDLGIGEPMGFDSPNQYDSPDDLTDGHFGMPKSIANQLHNMQKDRQTRSEPTRKHHTAKDEGNPFSLDWSESDEEDLHPMRIDFDSPPNATYRKAVNPTIVKRGGSGIGVPAVSHPESNNNEFVARPRGGVRPRGSSNNNLRDRDSPSSDEAGLRLSSRENSFDALAPPRPRGAKKDTPRSKNIAKPVQRRKPAGGNDTESPRLRTSASTGQIRPRGLQPPEVHKANSSIDVNTTADNSLKVKLPAGDGPVRRRGAAEPGPTPRRSKEPVARTQAILQVRRSTGSIPQKTDVPRPRHSYSPANSSIARPRGQVLTQSYQADY